MSDPVAMLTDAELDVLGKITTAHQAFCALPDYRPSESSEWVSAIHRLQDIVMSRAAVRAYPDKFTGLFVKTSPDDRR
jgi:hypothetical protein